LRSKGQISQKFVLILEITISNAEKFVKKFFIFGNSIEFPIQGQNFINFVRIVMRTQ